MRFTQLVLVVLGPVLVLLFARLAPGVDKLLEDVVELALAMTLDVLNVGNVTHLAEAAAAIFRRKKMEINSP